ncbi:MAG TPA: amidase [Thermoleophilaceae bacterium]|nr:amidase [Thermoleophilaceae bacterium]
MSDLLRKPASELASMVRSGDVSSRELVQASLDRIEATSELNHWTLVDDENALAAADAVKPGDKRPFAGVPIAIKDLFTPVAGLRMAQGSDLLGEFTPDYDYGQVRRLKEAGFVIVGKTQTPEFGITPVTNPRRFGPARNPWDPARTTGGSSGGSAGAVASGAVPIAHASDGGGSIRIPAACCGLLGLKPARGRISRAPDLGDHFLSTDGVLARSTEDVAALLDLMAGPELGDATWAPPPEAPFAQLAQRDPGRLRIALVTDMPLPDAELDPECERGAREAGELLEQLGHHVEHIPSPLPDGDAILGVFTALWAANVAASVMHGQIVSGNQPTAENIEPLSMWLYEMGQSIPSPAYIGAVVTSQAISRGVVSTWADWDLVVTPALAQRPVRHEEIDPSGPDPEAQFKRAAEFTPYTPMFNLTGQPAISVPLFQGDDGLPTAAQIVGPQAGEALLLQVARQLEELAPWADRFPAGVPTPESLGAHPAEPGASARAS